MRAEGAAALANFLLVLLLALAVAAAEELTGRGDVVVYANPGLYAVQTALTVLLVAAPLAAVASWRTWVHAQRFLTRHTAGWQGVMEAGALGFALTLPFVLPGVVVRQFNPGEWGQPQAFFLGLAYVAIYGLIGLSIGLVLGFLLRLSAIATLFVHRRITP